MAARLLMGGVECGGGRKALTKRNLLRSLMMKNNLRRSKTKVLCRKTEKEMFLASKPL